MSDDTLQVGSKVAVSLGPEAFRFESFDHWVDSARMKFRRLNAALGREHDTVCIDAAGRVCTCGTHFMQARDEGAYPVVVYHVRDLVEGEDRHPQPQDFTGR